LVRRTRLLRQKTPVRLLAVGACVAAGAAFTNHSHADVAPGEMPGARPRAQPDSLGRCQDRGRGRDSHGVLSDSLTSAFDRFDDFLEVQGPRLTPEAVDLLQAAAGVTESERCVIAQRVVSLQPPGNPAHTGAVLLGVLVGLFAAQFEHE
jgi:hypothetical protein